jgi:hypothetical protein
MGWAGASAYPTPFYQTNYAAVAVMTFSFARTGWQGLEFQEHIEVDLEVLRQLCLVGGEVSQEFRVVAEGQGLDHGGVDFGVRRLDFGVGLGMA